MSRPERRAGLLAGLALVTALLAGGALGYALGRLPGPMRLKQPALFGVPRSALLDSLGLTPVQRVRLDSILDASEQHAEVLVRRMMQEVRGVTQTAREAVRASLEPTQRERFDSLLLRALPLVPRSPLPPKASVP